MLNYIKKKIIGWIIDALVDAIIYALHQMSKSTMSSVDDKLVETLDGERETLKLEIQAYLNNGS